MGSPTALRPEVQNPGVCRVLRRLLQLLVDLGVRWLVATSFSPLPSSSCGRPFRVPPSFLQGHLVLDLGPVPIIQDHCILDP